MKRTTPIRRRIINILYKRDIARNCLFPKIINGNNIPLMPSKIGESIPDDKMAGLFSENLKCRIPYGAFVQSLELGILLVNDTINIYSSYIHNGQVKELSVIQRMFG